MCTHAQTHPHLELLPQVLALVPLVSDGVLEHTHTYTHKHVHTCTNTPAS